MLRFINANIRQFMFFLKVKFDFFTHARIHLFRIKDFYDFREGLREGDPPVEGWGKGLKIFKEDKEGREKFLNLKRGIVNRDF